jgi:hypothetical protein
MVGKADGWQERLTVGMAGKADRWRERLIGGGKG